MQQALIKRRHVFYKMFMKYSNATTLYHDEVDVFVKCDDVTQKRARYTKTKIRFK